MLLLFFLKSHTATLHSGNQASIGEHRFIDVSTILKCKDKIKSSNRQAIRRLFCNEKKNEEEKNNQKNA